jgi:hypothetical protein
VSPKRNPAAGMTLLELVVAMGLLAALGAFIVQLLKSSFDLYHAGEKRGEYGVNATVILSLLEDDLANVAHGPDGRFLLERRRLSDTSVNAEPFLRLVRTLPHGDAEHRFMRLAGTKTKPELEWWGGEPAPESRDSLKPGSGLMEVCYALLQEPNDDPGVLTLYRGVHSPVLEPGGFFDHGADSEVSFDQAWVKKTMAPVATGILGLDILCAGPSTRDWERPSRDKRPVSALETWDSTRGIMTSFPMFVGTASVNDTRDDLYPKRVRIALTLTRPGRPDARLAKRLVPGDDVVAVDSTDRLPREGDAEQEINVAGEWMTITKREIGGFRVARTPIKTKAGTPMYPTQTAVYSGRTFEQTINLPDPRPSYDGVGR